jgi:hypothetical protein
MSDDPPAPAKLPLPGASAGRADASGGDDDDGLMVSGMWPCDHCGGALAYVGTRHWLITQWRCDECRHEWEVEQEYLDFKVAYMVAALEANDPSYLDELDLEAFG